MENGIAHDLLLPIECCVRSMHIQWREKKKKTKIPYDRSSQATRHDTIYLHCITSFSAQKIHYNVLAIWANVFNFFLYTCGGFRNIFSLFDELAGEFCEFFFFKFDPILCITKINRNCDILNMETNGK